MKSKIFGKKLNLNKKTIADLKTDKMREVYGRGVVTQPVTPPIGCTYSCVVCPTDCTCGTVDNICPCASRD